MRYLKSRLAFVALLFTLFCCVVVGPARTALAVGEIGSGVEGKSCIMGTSRSSLTDPPGSAQTPFTIAFKCFVNSTTSGFDTAVITELSQAPTRGTLTSFGTNGAQSPHAYMTISGSSNWTTADFTFLNSGTGNKSFTFERGQMRDHNGTAVGSPTAGCSSCPDNYFEYRVTLGTSTALSGYTLVAGVPAIGDTGSGADVTLGAGSGSLASCRQAASGTTSQACISTEGNPTNRPTQSYKPGYANITSSGSGAWSAAEPDHFLPGGGFYFPPTCQTMGINYETRASGIGTSWLPVTLSAWPELTFGDSIRWTIVLPNDALAQIDQLWFLNSNHTPLMYTGDPPNYQPRWLAPFAFDPDGAHTDIMEQVESGIGIGTIRAIAPGDANAVTVGPATLTGTWTFLGDTGTRPSFNVWCHIYSNDLDTWEQFDNEGNSYGAGVSTTTSDACDETHVMAWAAAGDDTHWGFKVSMANSLTQFQKLEWRTETQDETATGPTLGSWATAYDPADTLSAFSTTFQLLKSALVNPYSVEWKVTCSKAGGGTDTKQIQTTTPLGATGEYGQNAEGADGCFSMALGSMDLTKPKTWVVGAGKLGVCLVEFLFVPSPAYTSNLFNDFKDSLEEQVPFSLLFTLVDFAASVGDELSDPSGTGCFDTGGDFSFGAYGDVDVEDVCIGDGLTVSSGERSILAALMIAPLLYGLCIHALGVIRGSGGRDDN